jgi:hypothetical protein
MGPYWLVLVSKKKVRVELVRMDWAILRYDSKFLDKMPVRPADLARGESAGYGNENII